VSRYETHQENQLCGEIQCDARPNYKTYNRDNPITHPFWPSKVELSEDYPRRSYERQNNKHINNQIEKRKYQRILSSWGEQ
jgi:hypothetical protein